MFESLSNETLIEIFKNLNHTELLKVSEVSKRFYDNATDSNLWKNFDINISQPLDEKIRLLKLSRFQKLKTLRLTDDFGSGVNNEIFQILMKIDLEELTLFRLNFESIDKVLLANVISKTKDVNLSIPENLGEDKVQEIMEKIPCGGIQRLSLFEFNCLGVDPRTVGRAINSLKHFHGEISIFEERQVMETLEEMSKETNLKSVIIESSHKLPARILSKALNNLEDLTLYSNSFNSFTSEQMVEFFYEMSHQTKLQKIDFRYLSDCRDHLESVPGNILARAICKLKVFYAPHLRFSDCQIKSIFQRIATQDPRTTRELDLGSCQKPLNLSKKGGF